jgi:ribosome maturation factor RimP
MIKVDKVRKLVEQGIEGTDIFVVDIKVSAANAIRVVLDADSGLSIDKCVAISRQVEHNLDRDAEDFSLEVTSFGLTQPLKLKRQYIKNTGRNLNIRLTDGSALKGKLVNVDDNILHIEKTLTKKEIKEGVDAAFTVDIEDVKEAKVEISFK